MASDEEEETEAENEEDCAFIDDGRAMKTTPAFIEDWTLKWTGKEDSNWDRRGTNWKSYKTL